MYERARVSYVVSVYCAHGPGRPESRPSCGEFQGVTHTENIERNIILLIKVENAVSSNAGSDRQINHISNQDS